MADKPFFGHLFSRRRWLHPILGLMAAMTLIVTTPGISYAFNWAQILMQGIQVVQLSNVSDQQEIQLGKQIDAQVRQQVRILNNPTVTNYLRQVGERLAAKSARPNLTYTYQIVDDDAVNAFSTMGGFVYINKGLLKTADNEAQLASVMGHEMGHITGKHALKHMKESAITQGLLGAAGLDQSTAVQLGVQLALQLPHSRQDEFDADRRGLINISRSGYDQSEMVAFMQKLLNSPSSAPAFLSTHPATADRITELKKQIQNAPTTGRDGMDGPSYKAQIQSLR